MGNGDEGGSKGRGRLDVSIPRMRVPAAPCFNQHRVPPRGGTRTRPPQPAPAAASPSTRGCFGKARDPGTSSVLSTLGSHTRHWQLQAGAAAGPEDNSAPPGQVRALQAGAEQQHPPTPQHPSQPRALPPQARPKGSSQGRAGTTTGTSSSCLLPRQPLGLSALFRASHKQTAKIAEVTWHRQSAHVSAQARSRPRPYKLPHQPCRVQLHPHVASSPDLTRLGARTDPRDLPGAAGGCAPLLWPLQFPGSPGEIQHVATAVPRSPGQLLLLFPLPTSGEHVSEQQGPGGAIWFGLWLAAQAARRGGDK